MHVHHKKYSDSGFIWDVNELDLVLLCKECHLQEHGKKSFDEPFQTPKRFQKQQRTYTLKQMEYCFYQSKTTKLSFNEFIKTVK